MRYLGLPREVLLQLARPEIATAIAEHSDFESDPLARFARTIGVVATVRFGAPDEAAGTLERLRGVHRSVCGQLLDGRPYAATDDELQFWVLATIFDTTVTLERRYVGALTDDDRQRLYDEQFPVFDAFEIPRTIVPSGFVEFQTWMTDQLATLEVTDAARRIGSRVVDLAGVPVHRMIRALSRVVTADLLPSSLREAYGLKPPAPIDWTIRQTQRVARPSLRATRRVKHHVPGHPGRALHGTLERWLLDKRAVAS